MWHGDVMDITSGSDSVYAALRTTGDALAQIAAGVPDWTRATPAPGWTVGHQVAHLVWTDEISILALTNPDGFAARLADAGSAPLTFVDDQAAELLAEAGTGLPARWAASRALVADTLEAADQGTPVPWFGPPMRPKTMGTARLMETWAHGQDIAAAAGVALDDPSALPHIARLGVRTRDFAFLLRGRAVPTEEFRIELSGPAGSFVAGPEDAAQRVSGDLEEFCLLVTQRIGRANTGLVAVGDDADAWLGIAQAFAGPAGAGR